MYYRLNIIMIPILFKLTYKVNEFPPKFHTDFYNASQADSKMYMEMQSTKSRQAPFEEAQGGALTLLDI